MTFTHTFLAIAALAGASLTAPVWAAAGDAHDSHHPAAAAQVAQAGTDRPGMSQAAGAGMSARADLMKAMQGMHERMLAAKTSEERSALMAEQMKLMQSGMNMMGGMGGMGMGGKAGGTALGKPADMATRQAMMEQRMDMMQSMMQMMMDRMAAAPAAK